MDKTCLVCNTLMPRKTKYSCVQWDKRQYCSKKCKGIDRKPENFVNWKGGRILTGGYWWIYCPSHPRAVKHYVKQSIFILEFQLKRHLGKKEIAHHVNCDKTDDKPENLKLCNNAFHSKIHALQGGLGKDLKDYRERNVLGQFKGVK